MRVHRLYLRNVKGVRERTVRFPDEGIVVIEGENEAGKTTMIEALDLLFDEKDTSRKRKVLAMRPVGLDVETVVEVEATSGEHRFTYRKQWFRRPGTVLTVTAPRREDFTGTQAHERANEILAATTDLDLWGALRLLQATPLAANDLSGSTALADALEEAAGLASDSAGAEGDSLLVAAEEVYREFFTATGRPTGEHREAFLRVEEARSLRDDALAAVAEVEQDVLRHADVVAEAARLQAQVGTAEASLAELQERWAAADAVRREAERTSATVAAAQQAFDVAAERAEGRDELIADVARRRLDLATLAEEHHALVEQVEPAQALLEASLADVDEAREAQRQARRLTSRVEADAALLTDVEDLTVVLDRVARLDAALAARGAARAAEREHRFDGDLATVEAAAHALDLARAEWRVGSATWEVTPQTAALEVRIDGETHRLDAPLGGVLGDDVEIVVPGVASLRLAPSAGEAERARVVEQAERTLEDLLDAAGVDDVLHARTAAARQDEARAVTRDAEKAVESVLAGEAEQEVRDRAARLAAHVTELLQGRVEATEGSVPDEVRRVADSGFDVLDPGDLSGVATWLTQTGSASPGVGTREVVAQARAAEEAAAERIARGDADVAHRRADAETARMAAARAEVAVQAAREAVEDLDARLSVARERQSDDTLTSAVRATRADLVVAQEADAAVRADLGAHDPAGLETRLTGARAAVSSLRERLAAVRDDRLALEARLRHAGEQGRAERLTEAETTLARAERLHASTARRAAAARALYETLRRHRDEVSAAYVAPFSRAVARLGRVVYGPDFDVEVGSALTIDARLVGGERIPYESLSSGAKEQMSILTRLACATLVDPEQGAPVILDDALGYSDPAKLQRVCSAFSLVGGRSQIILLTCTPGRYAAIPDAHVIRL